MRRTECGRSIQTGRKSMKKLIGLVFAALLAGSFPAKAVELTFYYPIAVGGPLTKVVDNLVAGFVKEHPDVKINAVYAGNYDDARIKALAALRAGQAATRLVKKDASGNVSRWGVMVPSTGYAYWMFQAFARENGQDLMNREGNQTNFAHPDVVGALQYWVDLGKKFKVMPEGTVEWGTLRQSFTEGKTAIMWHTTGNLTAVKATARFPFAVAMLPASKPRRPPNA